MIHNLFYFDNLQMGGTEQFLYEIAKKYSDKFDIVVAYRDGNVEQIKRLSKYIGVIHWTPGKKIECERAFLSYTTNIIDDLICDDIVMVNHANCEKVRFNSHPRIKRSIAVSEFTKDIFVKHFDIPTEVSYNPITIEQYDRPLVLMSAFRGGDPLRGAHRCKILAEHLDKYCLEHNKHYVWFIFSKRLSTPIESPNVVLMPVRTDVRAYMQLADWGISLPDDMETYGYTNVEFLMYNVPLVTTPLTVCDELGMDDSMRLVVDFDMSNVDEIIDGMFTKKMKFKFKPPKDRWKELLKKGEKEKDYTVGIYKVRATKKSEQLLVPIKEAEGIAKEGRIFEITEDRYDNLVNGNNDYHAKFAEVV